MIKEHEANYIKLVALEILNHCNINKLPVELSAILKKYKIKLLDYDSASKIFFSEYFYKCNGFTFEFTKGRKVICYDANINAYQIRYTIAHEIAHIALDHINFEIKQYEDEANELALNLLCPYPVLQELNIKNCKELSDLCLIRELYCHPVFNSKAYFQTCNYDLEKNLIIKFSVFIERYNKIHNNN